MKFAVFAFEGTQKKSVELESCPLSISVHFSFSLRYYLMLHNPYHKSERRLLHEKKGMTHQAILVFYLCCRHRKTNDVSPHWAQ